MQRQGLTLSVCGILCLVLGSCSWSVPRHDTSVGPRSARPPLRPAEKEGPAATNAEAAWEWRRMTWRDENGQIPEGALAKASAQRAANLELFQAEGDSAKAALLPSDWVSRGPVNVGGRTRSLLIDPTNPQRIFAGSVGGGLWRSTDGGSHWSPVNDFLANLAVCSLAFDPQNPQTMYMGTGEGFFNADAINGFGIFKSTDGGATWSSLAATTGWVSVNRIAVAPTNSNLILAAIRYGGIRRSTDGGATWSEVRWAQGSYDVAFAPGDSTRAIAHILDYDFQTNNWFHSAVYSTDGGASWQTAAAPFARVDGFYSRLEMAYAPSNANVVYLNSGWDGLIYKSTDGGHSYTLRTTSGSTGASWYNNTLWVDPTNPDVLVAGGAPLYRSTNGGVSLQQITSGYLLTEQPHPDHHCVVSDPGFNGTTNRKVYVCNDGGVFFTADIYTANTFNGWLSLNQGYQTGQYYAIAGDGPTGLTLGGLQDNGTLRLTAASTAASLTYGGDGGFTAIDSGDPQYVYGEYVGLSDLFRSQDGGVSISAFLDSSLPERGMGNFISPFILDPNAPGRMLAGAYSLWRSNNVKTGSPPTWSAIHVAQPTQVSAIAVAPGNSDVIWVAHNDGRVFKTSNGTAANPTWTTIDDNGATNPLPSRFPGRILIDSRNPNWVIIALGGFSSGNLQRSTDGGQTWSLLTGTGGATLPDAPIHAIAQHPVRPDWLYVGTEVGVFSSLDEGQHWVATNQGPANVAVDDLRFMNGSTTLLAATHGRGAWSASVPADGSGPMDFYTLTPCRLFDSRGPVGPLGGPSIPASGSRSILVNGACGIPASARALTVNVTIVNAGSLGHLQIFAADLSPTGTSILNFSTGQTRANNAVLGLPTDGSGGLTLVNASPSPATVILDVNGYFQ